MGLCVAALLFRLMQIYKPDNLLIPTLSQNYPHFSSTYQYQAPEYMEVHLQLQVLARIKPFKFSLN
jgi:hypothetical protein